MEITKVKFAGEGYLVNDTLSVPNVPGNRHFAMITEWLKIEGNNIEPEYTPSELALKELRETRAEKLALAEKMIGAGQAIIREFHILNQGDDITLEQVQQNAKIFTSIKVYLDAGSSFARDLLVSADLTGTSLTESDRDDLLLVWDSAISTV